MLQQYLRHGLITLIMIVLVIPTGCQSGRRDTKPDSTVTKSEQANMEGQLADSDAERAKAALERDWPGGERRPVSPERRPAVDQPQTIRR